MEKEKDEIISKIKDIEKDYSSLNLLDEEFEELRRPLDQKVKKIDEELKKLSGKVPEDITSKSNKDKNKMNTDIEGTPIEDGLIGFVVGLAVGLVAVLMLTWYVDEVLLAGFSYNGYKPSMLFVGNWATVIILYAVLFAVVNIRLQIDTSIAIRIIGSFIGAIFGVVNVVIMKYLIDNFSGGTRLTALIVSGAGMFILIFISIILTKAVQNPVENIKRNKRTIISLIALIGIILIGYHLIEPNRNIKSPDQEKLINSIGMEFIQIQAGEFYMGESHKQFWIKIPEDWITAEEPVHRVKITKGFYINKYEVTQRQWRDIMGNSLSYFRGDDLPVENVTWYDVQEFIRKLNEKESTNKYRLPSEAEWEYAARAGTTKRYSFGDDESKLSDYAWYDANSGSKTHDVGRKKSNSWGLYDMHGNVNEWVQDKWHDNYNGAPVDSSAWESGDVSDRVVRGGGWRDLDSYTRSSFRWREAPDLFSNDIGFRLARDL